MEDRVEEEEPHFLPMTTRWYAPGRPALVGDLAIEPAEYDEVNAPGSFFDPYRQHPLKGDFPLPGTEDLFLALTLTNRFFAEVREVPTRSGIAGPSGGVEPDFFGDPKQLFYRNDIILTADLFKGQQAFKPVDWRLRVSPVVSYNVLDVEEVGVVNVDVTEGTRREDSQLALQEALFEYHLVDLSPRYDFISSEVGIFPFRSDFRGFVFDDSNLGARIFGNYDDNKWQFNLVAFDMLDKDTNSFFNVFDDREQEVYIANVYRQDWPWKGYTSSLSFHYNNDHRGAHFDDNGFLVSPAPVGLAQENEIRAAYLGWAGEGHVGRVNVSHALYQVVGEEKRNPFAARKVDIDAQLAALEVSYDFDWWRLRGYGMLASGDPDPDDGDAEGFDAILDAPNFAGGEFSYFNSQAIPLLGVNLTNAFSPLPDLQTSKFEGQSNFVNPGLQLVGAAANADVTTTLRAQVGLNYMRFDETAVLEKFLELAHVGGEIGTEVFGGLQYRPLLTNNVVLSFAVSALFPGAGYERIYQTDDVQYFAAFQTLLTF